MFVYLSTWFLNPFLDRNRNPLQQLGQFKLFLLQKEREREREREREGNNTQSTLAVNKRLLHQKQYQTTVHDVYQLVYH